ncbi:MAG: hypothetical protein CL916_04955 [Deltaproteobacteria bacterium]|nr:hypothetical protein [Deltaproteobacteria bacterium]
MSSDILGMFVFLWRHIFTRIYKTRIFHNKDIIFISGFQLSFQSFYFFTLIERIYLLILIS